MSNSVTLIAPLTNHTINTPKLHDVPLSKKPNLTSTTHGIENHTPSLPQTNHKPVSHNYYQQKAHLK